MPRPAPAQIAYGSATVVCAALAMLLLAPGAPGAALGVIALAALALGVAVALVVPSRRRPRTRRDHGRCPAAEGAVADRRTPAASLHG